MQATWAMGMQMESAVWAFVGNVDSRGGDFCFSLGLHMSRGPEGCPEGPTVCAHGGTESLLPLLDNFSGNSRTDLFLGMRRFVPGRYKTRFVRQE